MTSGKINILLLLCLLFVFTGCNENRIGEKVSADKRLPLIKGSPQTGSWKAFEYVMNYEYVYIQPKAGTPGSIEFSGSLSKAVGGIAGLTIWIYLLDKEDRILGNKILYSSGYRSRDADHTFAITLGAPPETAGMSFKHIVEESHGHR